MPHRHALFSAARARRGAFGDTGAAAQDPVLTLIGQVNRFTGSSAPAAYRMAETPFGLATGNLVTVAPVAVVIYQRAATDSYNQYGDRGSAQQIEKANTAFADPTGFVSTNMAEVTNMIASLADSLGLPAANGESNVPDMTRAALIVGGIALVAWMLSRST
jgi:hypothetical protein